MAQSNFPALSVQQVQTAYLAFFNRPADAAGLEYWTSDQHKGGLPGMWSSFGLVDEFTTTYGADPDPAVVVEAFYLNMFNRPSDAPGKAYWLAELSAGRVDIGNLAAAFEAGAEPDDKTTLSGFVAASTAATQVEIDATFTLTEALAAEELPEAYFLSDATANLGEVTVAAQAAAAANAASVVAGAFNADDRTLAVTYTLADTLANVVAASAALRGGASSYSLTDAAGALGVLSAAQAALLTGAANVDDYTFEAAGVSFQLARGTETVAPLAEGAEQEAGVQYTTADADILTGTVSSLSALRTLDVTDVIDGGAGTDTLNLSLSSSFTGFSTGSMTNVEMVNLSNTGSVARTFDASRITGVEKYSIDAALGNTSITNINAVVDIALSNQASGTFSTAMNTAFVALAGTADEMDLEITGVGTVAAAASTGVSAVAEAAVAVTLDDMETINITAVGSNVISIAGTDARAVTVGGVGNVKITSLPTSITSFDASAAEGNVVVDTTNAAANALTLVATGSGNDTLTLDVADILANGALSGGDGTDTLSLRSSAAKTVQYNLSGFETLALTAVTTGTLTFSGTNAEDLTTVTTVAANTIGTRLVNMGDVDLTVVASGATVAGGTLESNHTGSTTLNYTAAAASIAAKTAQTSAANMTFTGTADLTVNVNPYITTTGSAISAGNATEVTVNVASGKNSASTPVELTTLNSAITAANASSVTYNIAGQVTALGAQTYAAATEIIINNTGSTGAMNLQAAALENLTLTSAKAFNLSDSVLTNLQIANITVNDGFLDMAGEALPAISLLTISGSGVAGTGTTASSAQTGNLGGDNAYNMSVVATGLKGGLTTGTVDVGAGQDITVSASEVTGAVTLGNIGAGTTGRNVTVTTEGTGGIVDIGNITASGLVTLVNSGAAAYTVDTIVAGSLNIDTTGSIGAVSVGANAGSITTTGALTITNASIGAFTSTAITAGVTGDVVVDLAGTIGAVNLGAISGKTVNVDLSNTTGGVVTMGTITARNSATLKLSEFQDNAAGLATITAATGSTELAVAVTGGTGADNIVINDVVTSTSIVVTGNLDSTVTTDSVLVDADASTAATLTISLAGISNYNIGTINVVGADAAGTTQSIVGGSGADTITFEKDSTLTAADTVNGGGGTDILVITGLTASGGVADAAFTKVTSIEELNIAGISTVTLGAFASAAGIVTIDLAGAAITLDAAAMTNALTINAGAAAQTITGGTKADSIILPTAGDVQTVNFVSTSSTTHDTITVFTSAEDIIQIAGALKTALAEDTTVVVGDITANTDTGETYLLDTGAIGIVDAANNGGLTVAELTTTGFAAVAASIMGAFAFTAGAQAGDVEIFAVESDVAGTFGVYTFTKSTAADATVDGSELKLIGLVVGDALALGDIVVSA